MDIASFGVKFDTSDVTRGANEGTASFDRLSRAAEGLSGTMSSLRKVAELLGVGLGLRELVRLAADSQELTNSMRTLTDSSAGVAVIHEKLFRLAQETSTAFATEVDVFKRLHDASKSLGYSQDELLTMTKAINDATELSGKSTESAAGSVMALARAFQTGAVDGRTLMTMLNQSPRLAEALAEGLGTTVEKLKSYGIGGEKAAKQLGDALISQAAKLSTEADGMADTINKATTRVQNAFAEIVGRADGVAGAIASLLSTAAEHMETLVAIAGVVAAAWAGKLMVTMVASTVNFVTQLGLLAIAETAVGVAAEGAAVGVRSLAVAQTAAAAATTTSTGAALAAGLGVIGVTAGAVVAVGALAYGIYKLTEQHDRLGEAQEALGEDMRESAPNVKAFRDEIDALTPSTEAAATAVESAAERFATASLKIRESIKDQRDISGGLLGVDARGPAAKNAALDAIEELTERQNLGMLSAEKYAEALSGIAKANPDLRKFIAEVGATQIALDNARKGMSGLNAEGEKARSWLDALKPEAARSWKDWGLSVEESRNALTAFNTGGEEGLALFQRQEAAQDAGEKMWRTYAQTLGDVAIAHLTLKEAQDAGVTKTKEEQEAIDAIVARIEEQVRATNALAASQRGAAQAEAAKAAIRSNDSATQILREQLRVTEDLTLTEVERARAVEDVSQREARANAMAEVTVKQYGARAAAVRASVTAHHDEIAALTAAQRVREDAIKAHEESTAITERYNQILALQAQLRGGDAEAAKVQTDATNTASLAALDHAFALGQIGKEYYTTTREQMLYIQQLQSEVTAEATAATAYRIGAETRDLQNRATVSGLVAKGRFADATREELRLSQAAAKADFEQGLATQKLTKDVEDARRAAFDQNQENERAIALHEQLAQSAANVSRAFQSMWGALRVATREGLDAMLGDIANSLAGLGSGALGDIIGEALKVTMERFTTGLREGVGGLSGLFRDSEGRVTGRGKAIGAFGGGLTGIAAGYQSDNAADGALTGAMSGFAVGGPLGAIAGGIGGIVGNLFGHANRMKQVQKVYDEATKAFEESLDDFIKNLTGYYDGYIGQQRRLADSVAEQQDRALRNFDLSLLSRDLERFGLDYAKLSAILKEEGVEGLIRLRDLAAGSVDSTKDLDLLIDELKRLGDGAAEATAKLAAAEAERQKRLDEDLDTRLSETRLSFGGRDGPGPTDPYAVEDRRLRLSQEREYADAVTAMWSETQLATLALIHQEEWLAVARRRAAEEAATAAAEAERLAAEEARAAEEAAQQAKEAAAALAEAVKEGNAARLSMAEREAVLTGDVDAYIKARTATIMAAYADEYEALKRIAEAGGLSAEELAHFAQILNGEAQVAIADFIDSIGAEMVTALDGGAISLAGFIEQMDILAANASQFRQQAEIFGTSLSEQVAQFASLYGLTGKSDDEIRALYTQVTPGQRLSETEEALNNAIAGYFDLSRRAADEAERARVAAEQEAERARAAAEREATTSAGRTIGRATPSGTVYTGPVTVQIMVSVKPDEFRDADRTAEMIVDRVDRLLAGKATTTKRASGGVV